MGTGLVKPYPVFVKLITNFSRQPLGKSAPQPTPVSMIGGSFAIFTNDLAYM